MQINPINDNVLIRRKEGEKKSAGGLFIPDTAQGDNLMGEILAIGPGRVLENGTRLPMTVKPGNVVLVPLSSGYKLKFEGEEFLMIQEFNILAVVSE